MTNHNFCLAFFGLGLFSMTIVGCPVKDAAFEPLTDAPLICTSDADCDDANVCTRNSCDPKTFVCVVSSLDGVPTPMASQGECMQHICKMGVDTAVPVAVGVAVATQVAGDCKKLTCDGKGGTIEINDDDDVKVDGSDCTGDVCTNGVPTNPTLPIETPCGQNMDLTCDGNGQCRGCVTNADCSEGTTTCASAVCTNGVCGVIFEPNGTLLPAQAQTAEDCQVRVCDGAGNEVEIADPNDSHNDGHDCTLDTCNGTTPVHTPAQAGASCNGNSVCNGNGQCLGALAASCAADNECSSGHCVDGVCCQTDCLGVCMSCNAVGTSGTCAFIPFPGTDTTCSGTQACDGTGICQLANGQSCNPAKKCASGTCHQGKCKSTTGQPCATNTDCVSTMCSNGTCT